jgi:hypothetical protein
MEAKAAEQGEDKNKDRCFHQSSEQKRGCCRASPQTSQNLQSKHNIILHKRLPMVRDETDNFVR